MTRASPSPRKRQPERRIRRTPDQARQAVLDAAERFFSEHPFSELRIDDLMRKAGMTRTAFYHYFKDLGDVAGGVLRRMEQDLFSLGEPWLKWRASEPPPREFLLEYFQQVANYTAHRGKALASLYHASIVHQDVAKIWDEVFLVPFFDGVSTLVNRHIRNGAISLDDPENVIRALLKMNVVVILDRSTKTPPDPPRRIAETITEIWYRTVYARGSDHTPSTSASPPARRLRKENGPGTREPA